MMKYKSSKVMERLVDRSTVEDGNDVTRATHN